MPRRGHGEGSIRKRPDGRWEARVSTPRGRVSLYGKTRAEVAKKLAIALAEGGQRATPTKLRLGDFLDDWLESTVKPSVKARTYVAYEVEIRCHIKPHLGHIILPELEPRDVQGMMGKMTKEGLKPATIHGTRGVLRNALNQAMRWGMIDRNPAAMVTPPRIERERKVPLTPDQAQQFLDHVQGHRLETVFVLGLTTGMRQGEILGLRWIDVDLTERKVHIRQILVPVRGRPTFGEPKTKRAIRTLRLPELGVRSLARHKEKQEEAGIPNELGLVFITRNGRPINGPNVTRAFYVELEKAGLPRIRFHDLRHACATFLLAKGVDIAVVRDILGHSQIATTADIYAHVLSSLRDEAADAMDDLFES